MPGRPDEGYVVNVQADLLAHLASRVVVPLLPEDHAPSAIRDLDPVFEIESRRHVLVTQAMAKSSVPRIETRERVTCRPSR